MPDITVRYGSFSHDPGEVEVSVTREVLQTDARTPYAYAWRADLRGTIFGNSQRDINTRILGLEAAYRIPRQDFQIVLKDGTLSALSLSNAQTNGGIQVLRSPSYSSMINASLVTFVNYQISLQAEEFITDIETALRSFEESISRSGGGPRFGLLEPLNAPPIRQLLKRQTIFKAVQSGSAVGLYARPFVPRALFPSAQIENPDIVTGSPQRLGSGRDLILVDFPISWTYNFESASPLFGEPNS